MCQIGTRFRKSFNCIPTFEKVFQLDLFQTELTNALSQRVTCQYVIFFFFFLNFFLNFFYFLNFLKKKCHVSSPCVCHVALSVPRGIVMPHVNITIRCHSVDFDLVPIYFFLFQFSTYLCVSDSILT